MNNISLANQTHQLSQAVEAAKAQQAAMVGRTQVKTDDDAERQQEVSHGPTDQVDVRTPTETAEAADKNAHQVGADLQQDPAREAAALDREQQVDQESASLIKSLETLPESDRNAVFAQVEQDMDVAAKQNHLDKGKMDFRPFLANRLGQYAVGKVNEMAPGVTDPQQLKQMAANNPQLAKMASLAQGSRSFLNHYQQAQPGSQASSSTPQSSSGAPRVLQSSPADGSGSSATPGGPTDVDRTKELAQRRQELEQMRTIYMEMWAEMRKQQMKRWQIMQDTMTEITKIILSAATNRAQVVSNAVDAFDAYLRS